MLAPWHEHPTRSSSFSYGALTRETVSQIARALKMTRKSVLKWIDKTLAQNSQFRAKYAH